MTQEGEGSICEAAEGTRLPPHAPQARGAGESPTHCRTQEVSETLRTRIKVLAMKLLIKKSGTVYV